MNKLFTLFILISIQLNIHCQETSVSEIIASIAEDIADDENDPEAVSSYIERLQDLIEKPVRINSADETDLSRLFFLTDFQIKSLADYVHSSGKIYSVYEIANIPGFDRDLVKMMTPFISFEILITGHKDTVIVRNTFLTNFSIRNPVSDLSSPGPPYKILSRYKFSSGRITGGLTAEKDAGERLLSGKPPSPDFLSFNLAYTGKGVFRKIIAGDFGARSGIGTNLNSGLRTGLSLTQTGYMSGRDDLYPYTSTDENNFFRGIATCLQIKKSSISIFYSNNSIDGSVYFTADSSAKLFETFGTTGYHNTASSIRNKDAVRDVCYGVGLTTDIKQVRVGLLYTEDWLSIPRIRSDSGPLNLYEFNGQHNRVLSAYYKAVYGKVFIFGEASSNLNEHYAFVQGLVFRPADRLTINILYRDYEPGFTSFHGKGLFSSSSGDNIRGIFGNFSFEAARYLFISAACDLKYYPWIKFRCTSPSIAASRELRIRYLPSEKLTFETLYSYRSSMYDDSDSQGIKRQTEMSGRSVKASIKYCPVENLTLGTRIDYKIANPGNSRGMLILQDINYKFRKLPLAVWFRYCIFHTDDWNSRLYTYENDILYGFSVPSLSGEGTRIYLMVSVRAGKNADFRIRYALTDNSNNHNEGGVTGELKLQARIWF